MALSLNGSTGISGINGSAGTPALQGGDADTGIFFGTDTASISTAGSQRLIVDSGGNIGLGASSPSSYSYSDLVLAGSTGGMSIVTATDGIGRVVFADGVAGVGAYRGAIQYDHTNDRLELAADGSTRTYLTSTGLGINTDTPGTKLEIKGTDGNFLTLSHATRPGSFRIEHSGTQSENLAFIHDEGDPVTSTNTLTIGKSIWYTYHDGTNDFVKDGGLFYGVAEGNYFLSKPVSSYSYSPTTTVVSNTFVNIVPNGNLQAGQLYFVRLTLTNNGNPYHHTAVVSMTPSSNNNSSPNTTETTGGVQHSHVGGGYTMTFRDTAGAGHITAGLNVKFSYALTTSMNLYATVYRLGH